MRRVGVLWCGCLLLGSMLGAQEVTYVVRGEQLPVNVASNGYVQTVTPLSPTEMIVRISTDVSPIEARGTYGMPTQSFDSSVPTGFALPHELARELRQQQDSWEAATLVLEWVMRFIVLDERETRPQDAVSVLRRRRARCSGLANAAAALLLAAGFESRTVSGLVVDGGGGIPHRWVECKLPGAGWVPTDPTLGLWIITPQHMAFADAVREVPAIEVVQPQSSGFARVQQRSGFPLRPNIGVELVCRVIDGTGSDTVVAILTGAGGELYRSRLEPEGRFSGLLPGKWMLVVERNGRVVQRQELVLDSLGVHSIAIRL